MRKRPAGLPGKGRGERPWEPTPEDLELYYFWLKKDFTYRQVGHQFDKDASAVCRLIQKIDRWLIPQWMDKIREVKAQHCQRLMLIYREAMEEWERSKQKRVIWKKSGDKMVIDRVESQTGDERHMKTAMDALLQIRMIWGMNAPEKVEGETVLRVGGLDRAEAIARRKAELEEAAQFERDHPAA
jgi:hypothetical protein